MSITTFEMKVNFTFIFNPKDSITCHSHFLFTFECRASQKLSLREEGVSRPEMF